MGLRINPALLSSGAIIPAAQWDFTRVQSLPPWATMSVAGNRTMFDSTGKLTFAPNNLFTYSNGQNGLAGLGTYSGNVTATTFPSVASNTGFAVNNNGSTTSVVYPGGPATVAGMKYIISAIVSMDDGNAPVFPSNTASSSSNTFAVIVAGNNPVSSAITVTSLGGGLYSVSAYITAGSASTNNGIVQYGTNQNRSFKVSGFTFSQVTYETTPRPGDQVVTTSAAYYGPRFGYDINGVPQGLYIEDATTNVALYCRDLTNAAWVKSNVTPALTQTGLDGVANSASLITATAVNGTVLQAATVSSSPRRMSAYVKRVTGSGIVQMTTDNGTTWTTITVTGSWALQSIPVQTLANPTFGFRLATNGDAIAVDFVQNEAGANVTVVSSRIYTLGSALSRAAETVTLTGVAAAGVSGSYIVETGGLQRESGDNSAFISLNGSTGSQTALYLTNYGAVGSAAPTSYDGSVALQPAARPDYTLPLRMGIAYNGAGRALAANGGAPASDTNLLTIGATTYLGRGPSAGYLNGYIRSLAKYNSRLPLSALQIKTNVGAAY